MCWIVKRRNGNVSLALQEREGHNAKFGVRNGRLGTVSHFVITQNWLLGVLVDRPDTWMLLGSITRCKSSYTSKHRQGPINVPPKSALPL